MRWLPSLDRGRRSVDNCPWGRSGMIGWAIISAGAVFAQAVAQLPPPEPRSTVPNLVRPDEAREAVAACGVPRDRVRVRYDRDMDEDFIWVARLRKPLAEADLACIARASRAIAYAVYFRDEAEQERYWSVYGRIEKRPI